ASETAVTVSVAGERIALGADPAETAETLARAWLDEPVELSIGGHVVRRSRESLGARVDVARLQRWLSEARDEASPMREAAGAHLALRMPASLDPSALVPWLEAQKRLVDRPAKDATLDPETGDVVAEREGRVLDVWATLDRV